MKQLTFLGPQNLEWREVPDVTLQTPLDAIVRPISVASCDLDGAVVQGLAPLPGPYAFGHESICQVVETGAEVSTVKRGDTVVCAFQISCGSCDRCERGLTSSCQTAPPRSAFGLGPLGGDWGSALSDYMRVPYADAMLVKVAPGSEPLASAADNIPDGWRTVGPHLTARPGVSVLILGGAGPGSVALYAAGIAVAMGAGQVDYVDHNSKRLEIAASLGANPIEIKEGEYPRKFGSYAITADSCANEAGLACALRSTEPGGTCTSTGIYFQPTTMPLLEMYGDGITFITGRVNARAAMDQVLALVEGGRFDPRKVTTETAGWNDAIEAMKSYTTKLVITREPIAL